MGPEGRERFDIPMTMFRRPARDDHRRRGSLFSFILALVLLLTSVPATSMAVAQDPPLPEEIEVDEPSVSEPLPDVPPTLMPEPTPTDVPVIPPTAEPQPTDPPLEPEVPTGFETPSPTDTPLPTAPATEAITPTVTSTPTPTPSPTPASASRTAISAASVAPGGAVTNCSQTPSSDVVPPGGALTVSCIYTRGLLGSASLAIAAPEGSPAGATSGWEATLRVGSTTVTAPNTIRPAFALFDLEIPFTVTLRAPLNALPGSVITTTVNASTSGFGGTSGSMTLSATVASFGPNSWRMSCLPATLPSIPRGASSSFTCTITALPAIGQASLQVRRVVIPSAPAGWSLTTSPTGTANANGGTTIAADQTLAANASWSFTVTLAPGCSAASSGSLTISTVVAAANGTVTSGEIAGPGASYTLASTNPATTVSASFNTASVTLSAPFSLDDRTVSGSLSYRATGAGCTGWSVSVTAQPFTYSGSNPGSAIPVDNLVLTNAGAPSVISGNGTGVASTSATGGLGTTRKVMTAQPGTGNGSYEQVLTVAVTVPGGTDIGTYRSRMTITTAAAP
jgi:hypothetical protein